MQTISLCIIVKNEEHTLGNCLSSVQDIVDEIVVVDTGSDDRTKEISREYTDKIFDFPWTDDSHARVTFPLNRPLRIIFCGWTPTTFFAGGSVRP